MYTVDIVYKTGEIKHFETTDLTSFNALVDKVHDPLNILTEFYIPISDIEEKGILLIINYYNASDRFYPEDRPRQDLSLIPKYQGVTLSLVDPQKVSEVSEVVVNGRSYLSNDNGALKPTQQNEEAEFIEQLKLIYSKSE